MIDRQTLANIVPLAAVVIALAEYLFDHTVPRYASPTFWAALLVVVGLLVMIQVLRYRGGAHRTRTAKPDYSATTFIRRRTDTEDRG